MALPQPTNPWVAEKLKKRKAKEVAIEGEVDKLCVTLVSGLEGLNKKVTTVNAEFAETLLEADKTVDFVRAQGGTLKGALAKLQASIGMTSNGGPPLDDGQGG